MASEAPREVLSSKVAWLSGMNALEAVIRFGKQAGAPSESETDRDGFLSHAAETHAAGAGLGAGFMIAASGDFRYFGLLYETVVLGNRGEQVFEGRLLKDIQQEKHYFLGGLVLGAALGMASRGLEEVATLG